MGRMQKYTLPLDGTPVPIAVKGATSFTWDGAVIEMAYQIGDFDTGQLFRLNDTSEGRVVYQLEEGTQLFIRQIAGAVADLDLYVWTLIGSGGQ